MRRKSKAELGTFSASAIDLFASALGAFIIIAVLLFPYFPNLSPDPLMAIIDQLRDENDGLQGQVEDLSATNSALTAQNTSLQGQVDTQAATIQQQQGQIVAANAQATAAQQAAAQAQATANDQDRQIADLMGQLDGTAFIGIEPQSRRFQLLFDMSGSIGPDPDDPSRYPGYVDQVTDIADTILDRLGERDSLRILTYQGPVTTPRIGQWPNGSDFEDRVSDTARSAARQFIVDALRSTAGFTPTFEALEVALNVNQPTTIIIVTDGVPQVLPTDGSSGASRSTIAEAVQSATLDNSNRHQINIVAIGEFINREQALAIIPLATDNDGALVAMP